MCAHLPYSWPRSTPNEPKAPHFHCKPTSSLEFTLSLSPKPGTTFTSRAVLWCKSSRCSCVGCLFQLYISAGMERWKWRAPLLRDKVLEPSRYHENITILSWHYHGRRRQGSNPKRSQSYHGTALDWLHHLSAMVLTRGILMEVSPKNWIVMCTTAAAPYAFVIQSEIPTSRATPCMNANACFTMSCSFSSRQTGCSPCICLNRSTVHQLHIIYIAPRAVYWWYTGSYCIT